MKQSIEVSNSFGVTVGSRCPVLDGANPPTILEAAGRNHEMPSEGALADSACQPLNAGLGTSQVAMTTHATPTFASGGP